MASWAKFNEKTPFGKNSTAVVGDNIDKSRERYQAGRRIQEGTATSADRALIAETDAAIRHSLGVDND